MHPRGAGNGRSELDVSVVVASHARPERLATLLDALATQTLASDRWEVIVVHTYDRRVAAEVLDGHQLRRTGQLRLQTIDPARARPSRQRNVGWRSARADLIAFTDDDCRPEEHWLERLVAHAHASPGAVVQGATRPDPHDAAAFASPHVRTLHVDPPGPYTQTCNILYEHDLLERLDGFDERAITGEDIDIALRAQAAGAKVLGAPDALVYHAIDALSLVQKVHSNRKWQHLAYIVKRHPELRERCEMRIWWKPEHPRAVLALAALAAARRHPWALAGVWPYFLIERDRHGTSRPQRLRAIREMPAHLVVELAEVVTFIIGSVRYRTLLL